MYFLFCCCSHSDPANCYCSQWTESVSKASRRTVEEEEEAEKNPNIKLNALNMEELKKKRNQLSLNQRCALDSEIEHWMRLDYWFSNTFRLCAALNECRYMRRNWKRDLSSGFRCECVNHITLDTIKCDAQPWHHLRDYARLFESIKIHSTFGFGSTKKWTKKRNSLALFSSSHHHSQFFVVVGFDWNEIGFFVTFSLCLWWMMRWCVPAIVCEAQWNCLLCPMKLKYLFLIRKICFFITSTRPIPAYAAIDRGSCCDQRDLVIQGVESILVQLQAFYLLGVPLLCENKLKIH